ncbi:12495_t:CDS:2 [Funneliformis geosporum]|uniref:2339_t:CDS:1 n=1 Tax=Funneliformis geosporum TaxID=1117311 RepID=A0A9W4WYG6_9GLOM|nr:2339_t:CDS:2 [Funneliformis geosporum]CAI2188866.1 12495_t:CDS:2 [Funneliformis geosporum]
MIAGVYQIPDITPTLLIDLLNELGDFNRKVAITIKNLSSQITFEKPEVYIDSGTSNYGLPMNELSSNKGLVWGARKTSGFIGGTVGVLVYQLKERNESLVFMWSVPYNYVFYSNWWNIKVFKGRVRANQALYDRMYHDLPHEGDNNIYRGILNSDLLYSGSMGNSGTPTIEVEILNYTTTITSSASVSEKRNY